MSAKNTPSSSMNADEQRVQNFLELAAPIILDHRELDEATWESLRELARQSGLSRSELTQVVEGLRQGGVIAGQDAASGPSTLPDDDDVEWWNQVAPTAAPAAPAAPRKPRRWANVEQRQLVATFLERARAVIAENRGIDARAYAILADLAHSLGLSEAQFDEAIRALGGTATPPPKPAAPPEPPPVAVESGPPRAEGNPADTYRQYLRLAIEHKKKSRGYISLSAERRLIEEGVRKLGLSSVFARHLVRDEAAALDVPILSQRKDRPAESEDPQFEEFVARAMPVLAQERGLTPKAHLMLSAIARELNLDEQAIQQAVEMLQRARGPKDAASRDLAERREAFQADLRRSLNPLAGGVIAPPAHQQLLWRGEHLYGLPDGEARSAIPTVAGKLGMSIVTLEQAAQYVSALIHERLDDSSRLQAQDEWEILAQGEQWGFTAEQLKQLVKDCIEASRQRRARERRVMTLALAGACAAVVLLLGAFYWFMFGEQLLKRLRNEPSGSPEVAGGSPSAPAAAGATAASTGTADPPTGADEAWWDSSLQILAVTVRRTMSDADKIPLTQLDPLDAAKRASAYDELVAIALRGPDARHQVQPLGELLARCLAREPDLDALQKLVDALLAPTQDPLPSTAADFQELDRAFAALRIWVAALEKVPVTAERQLTLAARLEAGLGESIRPSETKGDVENQAFAAVLRRALRALTSAAASREPALTMKLLEGLGVEFARYLTVADLRRQYAELLREALPTAGEQWQVFAPILIDILDTRDPLLIAKLIDAYEQSSDLKLRAYLGGELLASVGKSWPDAGSPEKVPALVRAAMGLPVTPVLTREQRVRLFTTRADRLLGSTQPPTDRDTLALEIASFARVATLGWALARNDERRFDELLALEEAERDGTAEVAEDPSMREELGITFVQAPLISRWTDGLRRARQLGERLAYLDSLRGVAEMVPDIHPDSAEELAKYLVSSRNSTEHEQRLQRLAGFEKWNNLRIALAQEVGEMGTHDAQVAQTLGKLYATEWTWPTDESWPGRMRLALLTTALEQVEPKVVGATSSGNSLSKLQTLLRAEWVTRLALSGVDRAADKDAPATQVLREGVQVVASLLRKQAALAPEQVAELDALPHELSAVDFLAAHDLDRAVRYELLWVRMLALELDARSGSQQGTDLLAADEVIRDGSLLEQLWGTQRLAVRFLRALAAPEAA